MSIVRVHYRERQRLSAADLRLEQDYRLGLGGRHDLAHHSWGIVRGLRLVADGAGGFLLTPGIAIDGYGREIFVPHPLAVDIAGLNQQRCWYVQLYYCERPQQACGKQPAPRIDQRPVVVVTDSLLQPAPSLDDLARARAAGAGGLAPWPVLVATFGFGCDTTGELVGYHRTRYAAHQAALIRAPNGHAELQLGLASRVDFYHFLLSTRGAAGAMGKRIGIDRHDTVHFWRPLCIRASLAAGKVDIGHNLQLHFVTPMPAGTGGSLRIEGQFDARLNNLTASLRASGTGPVISAAGAVLAREIAELIFDDGQLGAVRLIDANKGTRISFAKGRKRIQGDADATTPFSAQVAPLDAKLVLKSVPHAAADTVAGPCDIARTRSGRAESDLNALLFRPATEIVADPLAREIHAVDTTRPGDLAPGSALRIVGGAADDTDAAARVSIGARIKAEYHPALRMDGGRRIAIRRLPGQPDKPVLKVERTVYLPPIGAKDPLLPEMLVLAYMGGLRRIGNVDTSIKITLSLPVTPQPGSGVLATPPAYHIDIQPPPGTPYTVKHMMELITGADGKGDLTFRSITLPPASGNLGAGVGEIAVPELGRIDDRVAVTVLMLVEIRQKVRVVVSNLQVVPL